MARRTSGLLGLPILLGLGALVMGAFKGPAAGSPAPVTPPLTDPAPKPPGGPGGPDPNITYPGMPGWGTGYMCTFCGLHLPTAGELNHHRADLHFPPNSVTFCSFCDEMFFTSTAEGNNGYKMHLLFYHQVGDSTPWVR